MTDKKKSGESKTYQLKDTETSFFDDQTGFSITRDERKEIGEGAGAKTMRMIQHGGLVVVDEEAAPPSGRGPANTDTGDVLPLAFPARDKLEEAGITTLQGVQAMTDDELQKAVGKSNVEKVRAALPVEQAVGEGGAKVTK